MIKIILVGWTKFRKLNDNFYKLEAYVTIVKNINNLLSQGVVDLERCWANPRSVDDNILEEKLIQDFKKFGCNIDSSYIEVSHRITKNNDRVIVKFSGRKDCQRLLSIKKNLQKLKMEITGVTGDNKVFIDHSLCPYYRVLWPKSKVLLNMGKINRLMVSNGTVKVKISEISAPILITHADDFYKIFP